MNKQQKMTVVDTLRSASQASKASFIVIYKGLTVDNLWKLRKELHECGGSFKVAKARLMKRAFGDLGNDSFGDFLHDQIGVVFADKDAAAVAKVLYNFGKKHEPFLQLKAGFLDDAVLDSASVARVATLPSRAVLQAQVCGLLKMPSVKLVSLLNTSIVRLLWVLKKASEKGE